MDASVYVGELIAGSVYLFVGVRLYLLSRRTGQLPERLIAVSFLLWVLAYAFYDIPYVFVGLEELIPAFCSYSSLIALSAGNVVFTWFIRTVFRSDARWATWLVVAVAVSNFTGIVGMGFMGDWEGANPRGNPWYWLECIGSFVACIWMEIEGFAQYLKMRRRLKLGLCEPMACNRFLLWGIAGSFWLVVEAIVTASDWAYAFTGYWSESLGVAISFFELLAVASFWLVFFPPAVYCRWVEGAGRAKNAEP